MYSEEEQNYIDNELREQEPGWGGGDCPFCGKISWYFGGEFVECEECGKTMQDVKDGG